TRESAVQPADPAEAEAARIAKAALVKTAKASPEWASVPKALRKKDEGIVHALNASAVGRGDPEQATLAEWIGWHLERKPEIRKSAERIVRERAKAGDL